jgi:hypothetical protein
MFSSADNARGDGITLYPFAHRTLPMAPDTLFPSRKATKEYLGEERADEV